VNTAANLAFDFDDQPHEQPTLVDVTQTSQIDKWKSELKTELTQFAEAFGTFKKAEAALYGYINKSSAHLNEMSCTEEVINRWIKKTCSEASAKASNTGHLSITPDRLPSELGNYSFPRRDRFFAEDPEIGKGKSFFDATPDELASYVIRTFDFQALETELNKLSDTIEKEGFKASATNLGREFGLIILHRHNGTGIQIKQQRGRYILESSHYGSWVHDRVNSLQGVREVAQTFEAETGATGLVDCLLAAIGEERSLKDQCNGFVESRTKVNDGEPVEAVFFRDKIKYFFKPDVFEALVGFVQSYATDPLRTIEVK
jgi:hypothetical protein